MSVMRYFQIFSISFMRHFVVWRNENSQLLLTLLRKPLKEGMLIVAMMCADEVTFFEKTKNDVKNLLNRNQLDEQAIKDLLESAITASRASSFADAELIYDAAFNFQNDLGLARLFDKATHLVTEFRRNPTEDYNLNFIFRNPMDDDVFSGGTYSQPSDANFVPACNANRTLWSHARA